MIIKLNILLNLIFSILLSLLFGKFLIPQLKKLEVGQSIRELGPDAHMEKEGTPTMGGVIFLSTFLVLMLVNFEIQMDLLILLTAVFGFGAVGFIDDFIKVVLNRNLGLRSYQKLIGQLLIAFIVSFLSYKYIGNDIFIPFVDLYLNLGILYIPIMVFIITGTVNSVNLTDGLDGLASTVTIIVLSFYAIIGFITNIEIVSFGSIILIGALIGFLKYNWNPAKIFMGDVGSLALGGAVVSFAIITKTVLILPLIGVIYFVETLSVIIQVAYYKKYKKRIFKMSPLHHHYELSGFTEKEIVKKFSLTTLLFLIISIFILTL